MVRVFVGSFLGRPSGEALQGRTYSVFFAVALASVFVNPAFANEWNLYDSARVATFYTNLNLKGQGSDEAGLITIKNTRWELQGNSRIGANVKGDTIDARFEYGAFDGDANIRLHWRSTSAPLSGCNSKLAAATCTIRGRKIKISKTPFINLPSGRARTGTESSLDTRNRLHRLR